jgi:MFS family permease
MDSLLATVSGIIIFVGALIILDSVSRRRYKVLAFFTATTIVSGAICYISLAELPDLHANPWYWKAAVPVGMLLFAIIGAFAIPTLKRREK